MITYPATLPCPLNSSKLALAHPVLFFGNDYTQKRRPIAEPLPVLELHFHLSNEKLNEWNIFFYKTLKNGTLEFQTDSWLGVEKMRFIGKTKIQPNGNFYQFLSIKAVGSSPFGKSIKWKKYKCEEIKCIENMLEGAFK